MRYSFADCEIDTDALRLSRAGEPVAVEPQVFDLLVLLAKNAGRVVSKDEMIASVWQGRIVSDATISARINAARSAVGDDGKRQDVIRTLPRRGIMLQANVAAASPAAPQADTRQHIRYATSADGAHIAWAQSGSGPPVLRAGHHLTHLELDWQSRLWRPTFDKLGAQHTLIRYDARGTGLSDHSTEGADLSSYVDDLKAVADAAGLDRFPLIAHLQSAPVAIRFIADNPGRVTRLILHEGYCRGRAMRAGAPYSPETDPVVALMRDGWGDPDNGFMRGWASMIVPTAPAEDVTALIRLLASAAPREFVVPARMVIDRFTVEDCLDKVDVPTLIVHARGDTIHPVSEARMLAMGIADAELLIVESTNTICIPSDPTWEEQTAAIVDFLDGAGA